MRLTTPLSNPQLTHFPIPTRFTHILSQTPIPSPSPISPDHHLISPSPSSPYCTHARLTPAHTRAPDAQEARRARTRICARFFLRGTGPRGGEMRVGFGGGEEGEARWSVVCTVVWDGRWVVVVVLVCAGRGTYRAWESRYGRGLRVYAWIEDWRWRGGVTPLNSHHEYHRIEHSHSTVLTVEAPIRIVILPAPRQISKIGRALDRTPGRRRDVTRFMGCGQSGWCLNLSPIAFYTTFGDLIYCTYSRRVGYKST
jgi:hypothetical protein